MRRLAMRSGQVATHAAMPDSTRSAMPRKAGKSLEEVVRLQKTVAALRTCKPTSPQEDGGAWQGLIAGAVGMGVPNGLLVTCT